MAKRPTHKDPLGTAESKLLSPETWPDFEALFAKHNGVRGGCWCTFHLLPSSQYMKMEKLERRDFHRDCLARQLTGCVYYEGGQPIGFCQFGRAEIFEQINRMRAYKQYALTDPAIPDWRITCIFVDKHQRGRGLQRKVLQAALEHINALGGGMVEAFPFDFGSDDHRQYNGSIPLFEREGFAPVVKLGSVMLMRREIK